MSKDVTYSTEERLWYWKKPGTQKILDLFRQEFPQGQWSMTGGNKLKGCCPFHNDRSPSAWINLDLGFFGCSGCDSTYTDIVRLFADAKNSDYATMFKRIVVVELGLKVDKRRERDLEEFDAQQQALGLVIKASTDLMVHAANNPGDKDTAFALDGIQYLRRRGMDITTAATLGVGVFPRLTDIYNHSASDQRSMAQVKKLFVDTGILPQSPLQRGSYGGFVVFPYMMAPDRIGRLKMRNPQNPAYTLWAGPGSEQGFFGLQTFKSLMGRRGTLKDVADTVYLVEGEFDQLSFRHEMEKTGLDTIILCCSGAGVGGVDQLPYYGFEKVVVVGDHDKGGRTFAKRVISQLRHTTSTAVFAFDYPSTFTVGTDPDEIIRNGDYQKLHTALHDKANWLEPHEWGPLQIEQACTADPALDFGSKLQLVRDYGDLIPEGPARGLYIDAVAIQLGLSREKLYREMASTDTEDGFINALKREMSKIFEPLVVNKTSAMCYSKISNMLFDMPIQRPRDQVLTLQTYCFETDTFNWVSHRLGIPAFVSEDPNSKHNTPRLERLQRRDVNEYVHMAVDSYVAEKCAPMDRYDVRRQGVHFFDADKDALDLKSLPKGTAAKRLVVVNGLDVYMGELEHDDTGSIKDHVKYRKLDVPVHSKYLFQTNAQHAWSSSIKSVEDLNTMITYEEAKQAFDDVQKIVRECLRFRRMDIQEVFMPCYAFMLPLAMMTDNFPLYALTGPTQSGKSTAINGLFRNTTGFGIVEHATGYDDYTAAGLTQAAGGSSLLLCVDEFEDADDMSAGRRSHVVQTTLEMLRNIAQGTEQTRGTQSGEHRQEHMRFPTMAGMIHMFKKEEDLNRWVVAHTVPADDPHALPPAVVLRSLFPSMDRFEEIRRITTLYVLQNAGLFYRLYHEIKDEVFDQKKVPSRQPRFLHAIEMVLAIAKHFGVDYIDYARKHVAYHEQSMNLSVLSEEDKLFRAVFHTPAVILEQDGLKPRTITEIINDADLAMKLSGANCGVYYMLGSDYVVINPYGVTTSLLQKSTAYRGTQNSQSIFQRLVRHPKVKHNPQMLLNDLSIMHHLAPYIGSTPHEELLVVYLKDLRNVHGAIQGPIDI